MMYMYNRSQMTLKCCIRLVDTVSLYSSRMPIKEIRVYNIMNPCLYRVEKYVTVCNVATPRRLRGHTYNNSNNEVLRILNTLGNQGFKAWILKWLFCCENHDQPKKLIKTILGSFKSPQMKYFLWVLNLWLNELGVMLICNIESSDKRT